MARIISFTSRKPGIGKTGAILDLGFSLSRQGKRVLLLDCAPGAPSGMAAMLNIDFCDAGTRTQTGELPGAGEVVPVRELLALVGLTGGGERGGLLDRAVADGRLGAWLKELAEPFDYLLIDTPLGYGETVAALLEGSDGFVPMIKTLQSSAGFIPKFFRYAERTFSRDNPGPELEGVAVSVFSEKGRDPGCAVNRVYWRLPGTVFFDTPLPCRDSFEFSETRAAPAAFLPDGGRQPGSGGSIVWDLGRGKKREDSAADSGDLEGAMVAERCLADEGPAETSIQIRELTDLLRAICEKHTLHGAMVADEMGFALADFNISPAEVDALAAYTSVVGDTLAKAESFLELSRADTLSMPAGERGKLVFRRFDLQNNAYYLLVMSPREAEIDGEMEHWTKRIVELLA